MTGGHLAEVIGNEQDVWDLLPRVLAAAARDGVDVGDLLRHACSEGTRLLPKGMDLTENRSGSWEADHVASLTDPSAVDEGPIAGPLDIECPRCHTPAGEPCFDTRLYTYNKHPHRERVVAAPSATFSVQYGWTTW